MRSKGGMNRMTNMWTRSKIARKRKREATKRYMKQISDFSDIKINNLNN